MESTGIYAVGEMIDFAADHSEWVKENKTSLFAGLTLAYMAKNSFMTMVRKGTIGKFSVLCSKLKLQHAMVFTKAILEKLVVRASHNGVTIMENGRLLLAISVQGGKFSFQHAGNPAAAALIAATFAGKVPTNREEWKLTGENLAIQLSDALYSMLEQELRDRLTTIPALDLLSAGPRIVRNFMNTHPEFNQEHAVSIHEEVLTRVAINVGPYSLDGFTDSDGDPIIRVNGLFFKLTKVGDAMLLEPAEPSEGAKTPLDEDHIELLYLLEASLNKIEKDGGVTLMRVGETTRFLSSPFSSQGQVLSLLVDTDNPVPHFVWSRSSLIDDASENLEDAFGEGEMEAFSALINNIFSFEETLDEQKEAFDERVKEVLPLFGGVYRGGHIYMDDMAVQECMGKS
jgi:hypothetical protein